MGKNAHHHTGRDPTVLETLQTYRVLQNPVNQRFPQNFQMISTSGNWGGRGELPTKSLCHSEPSRRGGEEPAFRRSLRHAAVWSSVWRAFESPFGTGVSRARERKTEKLIKELAGGPCFEGTLRKPYFPNQVPWPGRLKAIKPSSNLRCQAATRVAKMPGQPHECSRFIVYSR
jgi:hypothetical protein